MPRANQDYNLYVLKPDLIMEWHPSRNTPLHPRDVTPGSGKKVWWLCPEGHEWQAAVYSRSRGSGCPQCHNGNQVNGGLSIASDTALATQWHPTKNGNLRIWDVDPCSDQKVWWICKDSYEWQATIKSRMQGAGCPRCRESIEPQKSPLNKSRMGSGNGGKAEEGLLQNKGSTIGPEIRDMKSGTDFRKDKRFEFQDTVMLENLETEQWSYGRSMNISGVGLFFESEFPYEPGVKLTVQFNNPPFKSMQKTFPTIVRWCKELPYDSTASFFGVGVEFA